MSLAVQIAVAEAIKDELANAAPSVFGAEFQPERSYADWDWSLQDLGVLHVDIVPAGVRRMEMMSRSHWGYLVQTDVIVRQRFGAEFQDAGTGRIDNAQIDDLVLLTQRIGEYFAPAHPSQDGRRLASLPEAAWDTDADQGTTFLAFYSREQLRENRQYSGVVQFTYRVPRTYGE